MVFCCSSASSDEAKEEAIFERVKRLKTRLLLGNSEFRFVSFNVPNLFFVEDKPDERGTWIPTDPYEVSDALATIGALPGRVVRSYTLGIGKGLHIEGLRMYNEEAFVALDRILVEARRAGVRLIIPLINNHFGGDPSTVDFGFGDYGLLAQFRALPPSQFFGHPDLVADFEHLLNFILTRINTISGRRYADDETILAWETGNELGGWDDLPPPGSWTVQVARFIKTLSPKALVIDGTLGGFKVTSRYQREALDSEYVDGFDNHYYGGDVRLLASDAKYIQSFGKVFVAGEFGFGSVPWTESFLKTFMRTKMAGCLLWSLRFHSRDGGFYTHSEDHGFVSYHAPGFLAKDGVPIKGFSRDEPQVFEVMRRFALSVSGLPASIPWPVPETPQPLPTPSYVCSDSRTLRWRGSAWALSYTIQRRPIGAETWSTIATNVSDGVESGSVLFVDREALVPQVAYEYAIQAHGRDGLSNGGSLVLRPL